MRNYLRLLRLGDQYPVFGGALASGIVLGTRDLWIVVWALACTCISIGTFILNELVDRTDVDQLSWNPVHIGNEHINEQVARMLCVAFTLIGLYMAWYIGLIGWGLLMAVWYGLYSWPTIRLKRFPVWDIVTQVGAGWVIPFGVPLIVGGLISSHWTLILSTSLLGWSIIFPYQLADYSADKRFGFRSTHVLLGIRKSLHLNICLFFCGVILIIAGNWHLYTPWFVPLFFLSCVTAWCARSWLNIASERKQEAAFAQYVRCMKPISQLLLPYVIILWFIW